MYTILYVKKDDSREELCRVELEVVPGGTYVVDGVPYKLVDKPTFHISSEAYGQRSGLHLLTRVELEVERIPVDLLPDHLLPNT